MMPQQTPSLQKTLPELYRAQLESGAIQADEAQERAVQALQRVYDDLTQARPSGLFRRRSKQQVQGLYLWGGVGRGKSMLMDMFYDALPDGISKRRVHFHEFMIGVHEFLHEARQGKQSGKAIQNCARKIADEARVLCFDEFHVTDIADAMILGRLFTALFKHGTVVVATSNWPPDSLYQDGLQRALFLPFIALLKEQLAVFEMTGETDYRLQCLTDAGVYFSPLGSAARRQANELFARLTDNAPPYEENLTVKGRSIAVPAVAKGVARFAFAALCERPLGAEDYLAIAKNYHTVFVEDVPRLKYDRRNEAKRLMTLVDVFYENGAKLVVTADAPPEKLYQGHDHGFEFQRTVSRLIEMQGTAYLKPS